MMAKQLRDVEKISRAAAEIENLSRTRHVQFGLANPADVDIDPAIKIEILWRVHARIFDRISPANLLKPSRVNRLNDAFCRKREPTCPKQSQGVLSCADQAATIHKFFQFVRKFLDFPAKSHWEDRSHLLARRNNFS